MRSIYLVSMLFVFGSAVGQNHWKTLGSLLMHTEFDEITGIEIYKPTFFPTVLELVDQEIELEGYIIPLTGKRAQSHFMFSAYPVSNCFFCGNAGPESVVQVYMKNNQKVNYTEDRIKVKGTFKINRDLTQQLFYNLENAEVP